MKTSLENWGNCDCFVIIASSSHPLFLTEYAANGLARSGIEINIENGRFTVVCSHCRSKLEFGNFTLPFGGL